MSLSLHILETSNDYFFFIQIFNCIIGVLVFFGFRIFKGLLIIGFNILQIFSLVKKTTHYHKINCKKKV